MTRKKYRVLVIDDDPFVRIMLEELLKSEGYTVESVQNGPDGLARLASDMPPLDLIISDMNMWPMNGLEFVKKVRVINTDIPVVILTVNDTISIALDTIKSGADDYILKDDNIAHTLVVNIKKVMEKRELKEQNLRLMEDLLNKNEELKQSNNKLVELNKVKNRLLGIAAHDLRSPISGVQGLSNILMGNSDGNLTDRQKEMLEMIQRVSNDMLALLDELLDVSIIESGKLELNRQRGSIVPLLQSRIRFNQVLADKKDMTILSDFSTVPETDFDANRINQAIDNFLTNAVKFSPMGSCIYVSLRDEGDMLRIGIRDEGPGIPEEEQEKLFGAFQKVSTKPTDGEKSTGLGLAISKKVIEAHGGSVEVDSRQGEGTLFSFRLPVR